MNQAVTAKLSYLRMSPRKARLVVDMIRGRRVAKALEILTLSKKTAARPIMKLLNSAIANAQHNFKLGTENLAVTTIMVDGGPMLKRWMPKAFGRAGEILKRTSKIEIILEERVEGKNRKTKEEMEAEMKKREKERKKEEKEQKETQEKSSKDSDKKGGEERAKKETPNKGWAKKIFQRKSM